MLEQIHHTDRYSFDGGCKGIKQRRQSSAFHDLSTGAIRVLAALPLTATFVIADVAFHRP